MLFDHSFSFFYWVDLLKHSQLLVPLLFAGWFGRVEGDLVLICPDEREEVGSLQWVRAVISSPWWVRKVEFLPWARVVGSPWWGGEVGSNWWVREMVWCCPLVSGISWTEWVLELLLDWPKIIVWAQSMTHKEEFNPGGMRRLLGLGSTYWMEVPCQTFEYCGSTSMLSTETRLNACGLNSTSISFSLICDINVTSLPCVSNSYQHLELCSQMVLFYPFWYWIITNR